VLMKKKLRRLIGNFHSNGILIKIPTTKNRQKKISKSCLMHMVYYQIKKNVAIMISTVKNFSNKAVVKVVVVVVDTILLLIILVVILVASAEVVVSVILICVMQMIFLKSFSAEEIHLNLSLMMMTFLMVDLEGDSMECKWVEWVDLVECMVEWVDQVQKNQKHKNKEIHLEEWA